MAELEKNPDASFVDASVAAGKTALNTWVAASPIKNFSDLFSSYEGLAGGVSDLLQGIPSGFIPSVVGATARTVDPVQRQTYSKGDWLGTLFGEMQAKIPGASKSLPAAYDTWGRPITRQNSTGEAAFAQFVSPGTLGNANESPIDNVILELFQDTGNNKVFPRKAGWSVTVDGESKSLTNREYSDYQREMGQMSYNIAEYLVPKFDNLTDEQKVSVLDNAYSMAKDVAENELFGADLSRTTEKRMEEASALDGTQYANWAEILFAHTEHLLSAAMEAGFDLKALPVVILGGGAGVAARNLRESDRLCRVITLTDSRINAAGFERLAQQMAARGITQ